ncbi:hypothetical protein D3C85_1908260 [compost metagenome]
MMRDMEIVIVLGIIDQDQAGHLLKAGGLEFKRRRCREAMLLPASGNQALPELRAKPFTAVQPQITGPFAQ